MAIAGNGRKKVGVIHSNETKVFELEVGRYELRIKTAMLHHLAEQSIDLSEQEVKKLELSANKKMLKKFVIPKNNPPKIVGFERDAVFVGVKSIDSKK